MIFYSLKDAPIRQEDVVFKQSSIAAAVPAVIICGLAIVALLVAVNVIKIPGFPTGMAYFIGVFLGLMGLIFAAQFRATLKPANWLLRLNESGLLIKYRSFKNYKLPEDDLQVVGLNHAEIAWVRNATEHRSVLAMAQTNAQTRRAENFGYLDLCLTEEAPDLAKNLQAECNMESRTHAICRDYPVQFLPEGILRLRWSGGSADNRIKPGLKIMLKELGRRMRVEESTATKTDFSTTRHLSEDELKAKVKTLAATGDQMAACQLAKSALRCSLSEARQYVDKVSSGGS